MKTVAISSLFIGSAAALAAKAAKKAVSAPVKSAVSRFLPPTHTIREPFEHSYIFLSPSVFS
jgi:hypothetical protein